MNEINPEHPTTKAMHDQWHTLMGIVLHKYRDVLPSRVLITSADIAEFERAWKGVGVILAHDHAEGLDLRIITQTEAHYLAATQDNPGG